MLVPSNLRVVTGISAFDMDQSGGLSREEVVAALEAEHGEIDPETVDPAVVQFFDGIFDHFDADKDGEITMKGRLVLVSLYIQSRLNQAKPEQRFFFFTTQH